MIANGSWVKNNGSPPIRECPRAGCRKLTNLGGGYHFRLETTMNGAGNVWQRVRQSGTGVVGWVYSGTIGSAGLGPPGFSVRVNANEAPAPVRTCPRASCDLLFLAPQGRFLDVLDKQRNGAGNTWYRVYHGSRTAWTYSGNVG